MIPNHKSGHFAPRSPLPTSQVPVIGLLFDLVHRRRRPMGELFGGLRTRWTAVLVLPQRGLEGWVYPPRLD